MPRVSRVIVPDIPHHVTQRGNYKQKVFYSKADYNQYLEWFNEYAKKYKTDVLSYCLMPNHVHFVVVPRNHDSLAKTFNVCHMRYAQYIHKRKNLVGHLWQGRFFSCAMDEAHTYSAIKYVENNPKTAKMVGQAEGWLYSSAPERVLNKKSTIDLIKPDEFVEVDDWEQYLKNIQVSDGSKIENLLKHVKTGRPLGSDKFISALEKKLKRRLRALPWGRPKK